MMVQDSTTDRDEIKMRFLELYNSAYELKLLFKSFFTRNSPILELIDIESKNSPDEVVNVLIDYLGYNFLSTAGKNYNENNTKNKDGKYLIRQKLLERICEIHEDPEGHKKLILDRLNAKLRSEYKDFETLSRRGNFNIHAKKEMVKILGFPDVVFESPPKENQEEDTTTMSKKRQLKPLYDYQVQAEHKIREMLSNTSRGKRILISVPTGAGKTRLTVEALINWLNDRGRGDVGNSPEQQKNGRIIFWFASTNELCSQAASEFVHIYEQIGMTNEPFNVTRLYGNKRKELFESLAENPGTHVVITNTEHFQSWLKVEKKESTYRVDRYHDSELFKKIREQTIALVIDEAHEAGSPAYLDVFASLGFDFSGRKDRPINRSDIVLIGLTATPYRGTENDMKSLQKYFGYIYIPIPEKEHKSPSPIPVIDAPEYSHVDKSIRISGMKSFDPFSELDYEWQIKHFNGKDIRHEPVFNYVFTKSGTFLIRLTVTNSIRKSSSTSREIIVYPSNKTNYRNNLEDNKEFNRILQDRGILCNITYGVIDGPQLTWTKKEIQEWKRGRLSAENEEIIEKDRKYNRHICDIIHKAIKKYGKKRVLVFANGVAHSHNLALILKAGYNLVAKSVDGTMNPGLRRQIIHDFRDGKIEVLCNHGILTSGFDVPEIDTLLICRTVGSNALYTQMIGRGQRGKVSGGTDDLWLITAYFKKGDDFNNDEKLGWEALADTWGRFPDEISSDLNVRNIEYSASGDPTTSPSSIESEAMFQCQQCGVKSTDIRNASRLFGVDIDTIIKYKEIYKSSKNCLNCSQSENNIASGKMEKSATNSPKPKIIALFDELCTQYGHVPTTRQFVDAVDNQGLEYDFDKIYSNDYGLLLRRLNIILADDPHLSDSLYGEYFEKCIKEGMLITREQLDGHGQYKLVDYEEIFGTFREFQEKTHYILKLLLDNIQSKNLSSEKVLDLIDDDLIELNLKLNHHPHFEDLKLHSKIGAHYYLSEINLSYLKYLDNYNGNYPGKFLKLVTEFFRLKKILGIVPDRDQFNKLTSVIITGYLGKIFNFNYNNFLMTINETHSEQDFKEYAIDMRAKTIQRLIKLRDEHGIEKINEIIDSAYGHDDELSISIIAWGGDEIKLKKQIRPPRDTST